MSHTTSIGNVVVRDIAALNSAVTDLQKAGIECAIATGDRPRLWGPGPVCDYVLKLPKCRFDVGFEKNANGDGYTPITDLHDGLVAQHIGARTKASGNAGDRAQHAIGQLMQAYTRHATVNAARKSGMTVSRAFTDDKGNVQLVLAA